MNKSNWLYVVVAVMLFILPTNVFAHTGLSSSNPGNGQTVTDEVKEITMVFNTDIEPLSKFEIRDEQGTTYKLSDSQTDKNTLKGVLEQPLRDGAYTVEWKIIGQDGHPITGTFGFQVEIPVIQSPEPTVAIPSPSIPASPEPTLPASPTQSASPTEVEADNPSPSTDQPEEGTTGKSSLEKQSDASWILLFLTVVFVILALVSFIRKRGKKGW